MNHIQYFPGAWLLLAVLAALLVVGATPLVRLEARRDPAVRRWLGGLSFSLGMALALLASTVLTGPAWAQGQDAPASLDQNPSATAQDVPAQPAEMLPTEQTARELGVAPVDESSAAGSGQAAPAGAASGESGGDESLFESESALDPLDTEHRVVIPEGRPDWVESRPVREGQVHTTAVQSELQARERDCWKSLDDELAKATRNYIAEQLDDSRAPLFVQYSVDEIKTRFVRPEHVYHEVVQVSFGPMHQAHALLEFPAAFRDELDQRWEHVRVAGRLVQVGGLTFGVLALLAVMYGYLRVDTATRGYYTARLQFLTAVAILAVIVTSVLIARSSDAWIRWLL